MWPVLPKDCNCTETASNPGAVCNALYTSNQFFYNGINSICNDLQNGDDLSVAIQKLENFLCSIEVTQVFLTYLEENIEEFPEFITLVNDALTCQTITNCFIPTTTTTTSSSTTTTTSTSTSTTTTTTSSTTSTTTTTTTAVPQCTGYVLESIIENASWQAVRCSDDLIVGEVFPTVGLVKDIGCVYDTTLIISGMQINKEGPCTTTTTTSSSTTTTTSSSTTTTTTTLYPCVEGDLLIINNTGNTVEDIYASGWSIASTTPTGPFGFMNGSQNGTNNAVTVVISNFVTSGCIHMYIGTVLVNSLPFYWAGNYTFPATPIDMKDCVWFIIDTNC